MKILNFFFFYPNTMHIPSCIFMFLLYGKKFSIFVISLEKYMDYLLKLELTLGVFVTKNCNRKFLMVPHER